MTVVCYLQELYPVEVIFTLLLICSVGNNKLVCLLILITYFYVLKYIIDTVKYTLQLLLPLFLYNRIIIPILSAENECLRCMTVSNMLK